MNTRADVEALRGFDEVILATGGGTENPGHPPESTIRWWCPIAEAITGRADRRQGGGRRRGRHRLRRQRVPGHRVVADAEPQGVEKEGRSGGAADPQEARAAALDHADPIARRRREVYLLAAQRKARRAAAWARTTGWGAPRVR